eukprot:3325454-Lingulodinium_polyedra.AAC.1
MMMMTMMMMTMMMTMMMMRMRMMMLMLMMRSFFILPTPPRAPSPQEPAVQGPRKPIRGLTKPIRKPTGH